VACFAAATRQLAGGQVPPGPQASEHPPPSLKGLPRPRAIRSHGFKGGHATRRMGRAAFRSSELAGGRKPALQQQRRWVALLRCRHAPVGGRPGPSRSAGIGAPSTLPEGSPRPRAIRSHGFKGGHATRRMGERRLPFIGAGRGQEARPAAATALGGAASLPPRASWREAGPSRSAGIGAPSTLPEGSPRPRAIRSHGFKGATQRGGWASAAFRSSELAGGREPPCSVPAGGQPRCAGPHGGPSWAPPPAPVLLRRV
jgi:hypothetical protein